MDDLYASLAAQGLGYGEAFQGLCELRRAGDTAYARVSLPKGVRASAERYGLHPALLDAALHSLSAFSAREEIELPFAWSDVQLYATGASELRVRVELLERQRRPAHGHALGRGRSGRAGGEDRRSARAPVAHGAAAAVAAAHGGAFVCGGAVARDAGGTRRARAGGDRRRRSLGHAAGGGVVRGSECVRCAADGGRLAGRLVFDATTAGAATALWAAVQAATARALSEVQACLRRAAGGAPVVWVTGAFAAADPRDGRLVACAAVGPDPSARNEQAERTLRMVDIDAALEPPRELLRALSMRNRARVRAASLAPRGSPCAGGAPDASPKLPGTVL